MTHPCSPGGYFHLAGAEAPVDDPAHVPAMLPTPQPLPPAPLPDHLLEERRTPEGALIRAALDHARALAGQPVPPGHQIRVEGTFEGEAGELGVAWLTPRGWTLEASAKAALAERKVRSVRLAIQITL